MRNVLIVLLIAALPAICSAEDFSGYQLANIRVIDGDTIEADVLLPWNVTLRQQMIRASDYDAWESSKRRRSVQVSDEEVEKGKTATIQLKHLVDTTTIFAVPAEETRDNYGRILAQLYYVDENGRRESIAQMMHRGRHVRVRSIE